MCGIFGVIGSDNAFVDLYKGLKMIQHRGQDTCGIATYDNHFNIKKCNGLVTGAFDNDDVDKFKGSTGIGHVRYPTIGKGGVENAQPLFVNIPYGIIMAHNGNVLNYFSLKKKLQNVYNRYINTDVDVEIILNIFAHYLEQRKNVDFDSICDAVKNVFNEVQGSYSVIAYIANKGFLAFRDPKGFKPLIYGKKNQKHVFASESVSLDILGIREFTDVKPGEVIFIADSGEVFKKRITKSSQTACIFEWVYFARPDSTIDSMNVYKVRYDLGEKLADELMSRKNEFDVCMPVPDTSRTAALACANKLGIPYREGLIKNRYVGRTFIMSGNERRKSAVREKLNPIRDEIIGKSILLIDDSIVRGHTSKSIVEIVKQAGAKEVHFAVYSPPLKYPCFFGIDMQRKDEFIANKMEIENIKDKIGADSLHYLSIKGLIEGMKQKENMFCDACFSGNYPVNVDENHVKDIQSDRNLATN